MDNSSYIDAFYKTFKEYEEALRELTNITSSWKIGQSQDKLIQALDKHSLAKDELKKAAMLANVYAAIT